MDKKFKIDRKELSNIIEQYEKEKGNITQEKYDEYKKKVMNSLGTDVLDEAIDESVLEHYTKRILNKELIHDCYSNEDFFKMIEGISNYEIVGDWQHFLTVNSEYLFKLPVNMQEKFAEKNGIDPLEYLSMKYTNLSERQQELFEIENTYMKNSNFTNFIKKAMITNVKNRVPVIKRMQEFFYKHIKRNSKENNHDKDIEDLSR